MTRLPQSAAPNRDANPFPDILDTRDGLDRIMGDHALYGRMLARFRQDYRAGVLPLRLARDGGDTELAHRIAHTLKGAAGMIGAQAVHDQAGVLETVIRTHADGVDAAIGALEPLLVQLLSSIDALRDLTRAEDDGSATASLALLDDAARLTQFVQLLEDGDGAAIDVLEHSAATLTAVLGPVRYAAVAAATQEFDFEGALTALRMELEDGRCGA